MPRFKTRAVFNDAGNQIGQEDIPFSTEEEEARDAEEAAVEKAKPAQYWAALRKQRNALLASSDWTQYNDSPLTNENKAGWAKYRQELRDLPAVTTDPADPTWPSAPE